jgi:hypothetical protein
LLIRKSLAPDSNENPFYFSFKNKKIVTDNWARVKRTGEAKAPKNTLKKYFALKEFSS